MFALTACEKKARQRFRATLKRHLPPRNSPAGAIVVKASRASKTPRLGDVVHYPESDITHVFNTSVVSAISHAIEDLAAEVGEGELIATFQKFDHFLPRKKHYLTLAKSLDFVRVWGSGKKPERCSRIDFIDIHDPRLSQYWLVLFRSCHCRAVLFCKQINSAQNLDEKKFVGFYSFNPYLVQSISWRFNLLSCNIGKVVANWEKTWSLPELKLRDLNQFLKSEPKTSRPASKAKAKR